MRVEHGGTGCTDVYGRMACPWFAKVHQDLEMVLMTLRKQCSKGSDEQRIEENAVTFCRRWHKWIRNKEHCGTI